MDGPTRRSSPGATAPYYFGQRRLNASHTQGLELVRADRVVPHCSDEGCPGTGPRRRSGLVRPFTARGDDGVRCRQDGLTSGRAPDQRHDVVGVHRPNHNDLVAHCETLISDRVVRMVVPCGQSPAAEPNRARSRRRGQRAHRQGAGAAHRTPASTTDRACPGGQSVLTGSWSTALARRSGPDRPAGPHLKQENAPDRVQNGNCGAWRGSELCTFRRAPEGGRPARKSESG